MSRKQAKTINQIESTPEVQDKRKEPKEFEIEREPTGLYRIKYSAGGEVPNSLKGMFTTVGRAQTAINNELSLRKQKETNAG